MKLAEVCEAFLYAAIVTVLIAVGSVEANSLGAVAVPGPFEQAVEQIIIGTYYAGGAAALYIVVYMGVALARQEAKQ
jgi:hypothetical protein